MVELHDVSFSYTKEVGTLTHVDLTIRPGECVLLCGASGCGKTTITKLVNGLIPAFTEDCTLTGQVLLHGAPVRCTDLRGGAALCVAALAAEGETRVSQICHIDRGYEDLVRDLRALGADAERMEQTENDS